MSSTKRSVPLRVSVVPAGAGWSMRREPGDATMFDKQEDALRAAQELVRETGGEIRVHQSNGRVRESFTLGRLGMRKLAAVEGLTVTADMVREVADFDRRGLSSRERRDELARRFKKAAR